MIWDSGYQSAYICELSGGGAGSVATKKSTSPAQIWFRRSNDDGATWSTPVQVGTLTSGKSAQVHQKALAGSGVLVVTNGVDSTWQSSDGGKTWEAME
jgi:hypothetical protein